MCVLFIYTISLSIICVSQAEPGLIASSNQQIYDFVKKNTLWKVNFNIRELVCVIQIPAVSICQVMLMYIYMGVSVYWPLSVLYIFVCICVCGIKS